MNTLYLVNEGTVAVEVMAIALFIAFGMVIALGAYVLYCDRLNRAWEASLVDGGEVEPAATHSPDTAVGATTAEAGQPARRRRAQPPEQH